MKILWLCFNVFFVLGIWGWAVFVHFEIEETSRENRYLRGKLDMARTAEINYLRDSIERFGRKGVFMKKTFCLLRDMAYTMEELSKEIYLVNEELMALRAIKAAVEINKVLILNQTKGKQGAE